MLIGHSELHVVCDGHHTQAELDKLDQINRYFAPTVEACLKMARQAGWQIQSRTGVAWCPDCAPLPMAKRKRIRNIYNREDI